MGHQIPKLFGCPPQPDPIPPPKDTRAPDPSQWVWVCDFCQAANDKLRMVRCFNCGAPRKGGGHG